MADASAKAVVEQGAQVQPRKRRSLRRPRLWLRRRKLQTPFGVAAALLLVAAGVSATHLRRLRPLWTTPKSITCAPAPDVDGVWTGHSWAYVVAAPAGPVLVDAGSDASLAAIAGALGRRGWTPADVRAVLLTHGHADHVAGLGRLPRARVYVAAADAALARGDVAPGAWAYAALARLGKRPRDARAQVLVAPGDVLQVAGARFTALPLPGHTKGSVAYRYGNGVFVGDAALPVHDRDRGGTAVHQAAAMETAAASNEVSAPAAALRPLPWPCNEADKLATQVLPRLGNLAPAWVAFGHALPARMVVQQAPLSYGEQ